MNYLRIVVGTVLASTCFSASDSLFAQQPTLPTVVVNPVNGPSFPIYLGNDAGYGAWTWDSTGSSRDEVTPEDFNAYNAPPQCSLLAITGRPTDCTRQMAGEFENISIFNMPVVIDEIPEFVQIGNMMNTYWWGYNAVLQSCYADPANDADECEASYYQGFSDYCGSGYWPPGDSALCQSGLDRLQLRLDSAAFDRTIADWMGIGIGAGWAVLTVDVNWSLGQWLATINPYNEAYFRLRKGDACSKWYQLWDDEGCSSYYNVG